MLLVGETRDKETAHTAVEAALTGHLVFTTLHTNSAAVAFTRLQRDGDRAVPRVVVDDRRHRAAARAAAVPDSARSPYAAERGRRARSSGCAEGATLYRARGCAACDGKGVKGRVGIYEVMRMNAELRQMVGRGAPAEEIHAAALANGMIDLKGYAALLLAGGLTTVDEVTSVVSIEG